MISKKIEEINKFFALTYFWVFLGFLISGLIGYLISRDISVIRPFITKFEDPRISIIIFVVITVLPIIIIKIFWRKLPIRSLFILYPLAFSLLGISLTAFFIWLKLETLIYLFFGVAIAYLQISLTALFSKEDFTSDEKRLYYSVLLRLGSAITIWLYGDDHSRRTEVIVEVFAMLRYIFLTKRHTQEVRNQYIKENERKSIDSIRGAGVMYVDFFLLIVYAAKIYMHRGAAKAVLSDMLGDKKDQEK